MPSGKLLSWQKAGDGNSTWLSPSSHSCKVFLDHPTSGRRISRRREWVADAFHCRQGRDALLLTERAFPLIRRHRSNASALTFHPLPRRELFAEFLSHATDRVILCLTANNTESVTAMRIEKLSSDAMCSPSPRGRGPGVRADVISDFRVIQRRSLVQTKAPSFWTPEDCFLNFPSPPRSFLPSLP